MDVRLDDLRESNEFLNILLDNISSAIFIVDKNVKIQEVNNSFEILFQRPSDKILGELCGNAIGCSYTVNENKDCGQTTNCNTCVLRSSILNSFVQKIPSNKELLVREFYIDEKKIIKYYQFSSRYIQYLGDEMVLIIVDDITEIERQKIQLKERNENLKKSNDEKNKLLGIAAHDIRSPLAIISSYASFLSDENMVITDEIRSKYLEIIHERSDFGLDLLDDILDFSKIEAGEINLDKNEVKIVDFISKIVNFNQVLATKKNQIINLEYNIKDIILSIDKFKIEQVVNNLLSNAIKYSPKNTDIEVTILRKQNFLQVEVSDKGPGIPEIDLDTIFKPFQTSSNQTANSEKSTGLGLAISRKIIHAHNGEIGVRNNKIGATFFFSLPID
jgi:signal transduction histidine kinase